MNHQHLDTLRTALTTSRDQLTAELASLQQLSVVASTEGRDLVDEVDRASAAESMAENNSRAEQIQLLLENTDRALELMSTEGYGQCRDCSESIPIERLQALPRATRCVPCATRLAA
ncbi:hypothetical protein BHE97_02515 [Aeromicrobium sp. PE09-221]|uniref:TraR/DksA family transcriptional regulator n=1 Tax=Aeromicrobium sp. PE09-221 TaxID=1898043 RepID=UPI000B3E74E7|nr:TraR/DksA C4-type zinc finger protein [Aeromicrobium sp. PE09-221]OUZ12294.1 hypothetical protein BHE97_02515 [Aeromicrobium sp. PE09-221]